MTQSLVVDRDVDLRNQYDSGAYHAFHAPVLEDRHIIQVGEAQYPIRDLGLPLLSTLPFAIAGRVGVLVLMCIVGAALAAQLYLACRDFGIAQRRRSSRCGRRSRTRSSPTRPRSTPSCSLRSRS